MHKKLLCVAIMVKNEEPRIERTLQTIIKYVDHVVILDTGSDDNTIQVIKDFCSKHNKPLKLEIEPFVDFSYNRNILLSMCYGLSEFILLLDANDEVKNPEYMLNFLQSVKRKEKECVFRTRFQWDNDTQDNNNITYNKISIIRNNKPDIIYDFPVHEYITSKTPNKYISNDNLIKTDFYIYQDRKKDKSSVERIYKDIDILNKYIETNGENIRAYRYLCQSYNVIKDYENLSLYADKMIQCIEKISQIDKYNDDYYYALMSKGVACGETKNPNFAHYLMRAYKHSCILLQNATPLYEIAKYYFMANDIDNAYKYIKKCCLLIPPSKNNLKVEFINFETYNIHRWTLLYGIAEKMNNIDDMLLAREKTKGLFNLPDPLIKNISKRTTNINDLNDKQKEAISNLLNNNNLKLI